MSLLPWHSDLAARVEELVASEKLPHAILVTGPEGWGERVFADWLALVLLGQSGSLEASNVAHPDLRWVRPDGAEIKVDAIREVGEFAFKTSLHGARKVVVLEDAHLLNRNAANALLKTLEEPPQDTFILLASCHSSALLPTIRSRCQRFAIQPSVDMARSWLAGLGDQALEERLLANGGAPLLVAGELAAGTPPLGQILAQVLASKRPRDYVGELLERDPGHVTGGWYRYIADSIARPGRFDELAGVPLSAMFRFADELLWIRYQLTNSNSANARLLLERLTVQWHDLGSGRSN